MRTVLIPGKLADQLGVIAMRSLANQTNCTIEIYGASECHKNVRTFEPNATRGVFRFVHWLQGAA